MRSERKPNDVVEARRRFLATCGKFSVATPPAIALLLATADRNYAVAQSGAANQTKTTTNFAHTSQGHH